MVSRIATVAFEGIDVRLVDVQVQISGGGSHFTIVGLPDKAVAESRERVRSALSSIGLGLPPDRITVNLSPADILKEGSHFDLPIALGLLMATGVLPQDACEGMVALGELALDGRLSHVNGVLPAAMGASARDLGLICPAENGAEAAWAGENLEILAPASLLEIINHFKGDVPLARPQPVLEEEAADYPDMAEIRGQQTARRALEIAAAGGHNLLMSGPPGAGKSMLASRLPGILPALKPQEMLELSMIHSIAGQLKQGRLTRRRPFRSPHHNCSMPAMTGGGRQAKPGEISLAHQGVLFLDELPEFPAQVLDSLRQPLESREVSIARVQAHITYPADVQLIAAMNPCRCGYLDDPGRACSRAPRCAVDYQAKLSGPLLDRIDLHIEVPALRPQEITSLQPGEDSATVRARVMAARQLQQQRYAETKTACNARAEGDLLLASCRMDGVAKTLLEQGVEKLGLSMRGYNRILRVARTIADLATSQEITEDHVAEALSYRQMAHLKQAA